MATDRTFGALFPTWAIVRTWALLSGLQVIAYPNGQYLFSDVRLYDWWAGNIVDGFFPINDPMWQYPPIAAVIFALGYLIHPEVLGFISLVLVADVMVLVLLAHTGRKKFPINMLPAWMWVSVPVVMGPLALGRFDVFPTAAAIFAVLATRQPIRGAHLAIGSLLKLWPGLGLLALKRKELKQASIGFLVTICLVTVMISQWWSDSFGFIVGQRSRGLQIESVGALPYMLWNVGPSRVAVELQFGSIEVIARGTWWVGAIATVIALLFFATMAMWRIQGRLENIPFSDVFLALVLTAMITSRVLSPQFSMWALGLVAVCAFNPQPRFRVIATLVFVSAFCGHLMYPWLYPAFQSGSIAATGVQVIRLGTLLTATVLCWLNIRVRLIPVDLSSPLRIKTK